MLPLTKYPLLSSKTRCWGCRWIWHNPLRLGVLLFTQEKLGAFCLDVRTLTFCQRVFSMKPLKVKLVGGEQKATKKNVAGFRAHRGGICPGAVPLSAGRGGKRIDPQKAGILMMFASQGSLPQNGRPKRRSCQNWAAQVGQPLPG